jgi:hypothetical protein
LYYGNLKGEHQVVLPALWALESNLAVQVGSSSCWHGSTKEQFKGGYQMALEDYLKEARDTLFMVPDLEEYNKLFQQQLQDVVEAYPQVF